MTALRVVRVYHAGRNAHHRERDRALVRAGIDVTLVVPTDWAEGGGDAPLTDEPFDVVELPVLRSGDVNRHRYADPERIAALVGDRRPDVVDLHEEPFSSVVHQLLGVLPLDIPVVTYTAQNIDKRFPPPFAQWETKALGRIQGIYPCSRQAASVAVGKGFEGAVQVLPLPPHPSIAAGGQDLPADVVQLLLAGRLVPEKGVLDAVRVLHALCETRDARLTIVGSGPESTRALALASSLGVLPHLEVRPWVDQPTMAGLYAQAHIVLVPSTSTRTWVEQFGRIVVEAHAAGAVPVAYASGSLPEVVGREGVLVTEGDVEALVRATTGLVDDPARWRALREAGLARARTCTWDEVARGQIALYEQALAVPTRPRHVRPHRALAVARYGPPAHLSGGDRPFALPVLRESNGFTRGLAHAIDAMTGADATPHEGRLRVVYLDHIARLSGGELALARLIGAMPEVEAHVILGEDGPLRGLLESNGATVEVIPFDPATLNLTRHEVPALHGVLAVGHTAAYTARIARRLRALRPDLVHTNSLKAGYYGSVAARAARIPVIWHVRDRIAADYMPGPVVRLTRTAIKSLPNAVLCNSAATLATLAGTLDSSVIASPVVYDPYRRGDAPSVPRDDHIAIGILGRLARWKGQDVFLRAFAAADLGPDVVARIIGSAMFGPDEQRYADSLIALADELGIRDRVDFRGFAGEVERELAALDILVHASTVPEPFGQVVVEGMAAGLPVIATRAGGPLEIIADGQDGLLVPPGDVAALARAMQRLVSDSELRARLRIAAVARAGDFAPEVIGPQVEAFYREVLRRHGR